MHIVPQYEPKIKLIKQTGEEIIYKNYEEFLKYNSLHFIKNHVVTTFRDWPVGARDRIYYCLRDRESLDLYVVRDEFGSVLSAGEIIQDQEKRYREQPNYKRFGFVQNQHIYRRSPVPNTGKRNWHFGSYYRRPKTTQEKRWNEAHKDYVRGRRHSCNIPTSYDDKPRSDIGKKSWKNQKKRKQWMKK